MKTFSHGGRFGDLFYALWTMRELGGGRLIVTDFHQGNWSLEMAKTLESFLLYQPFIDEVEFRPYSDSEPIDYDLHQAENDFNPEAFPECPELDKDHWPASANIAKRYAVHFGLTYRPGEKWLEAPFYLTYPVIMHIPKHRTLRSHEDWMTIREGLKGMTLEVSNRERDWMDTAMLIGSTQLFLGNISGPHALAEGLGKTRLVEQAPDCFNVSILPPSQCINGWSNNRVVQEVRKLL